MFNYIFSCRTRVMWFSSICGFAIVCVVVSCFHSFVSSVSLPGDDVLCWLLQLSVLFCLLPLLFFSDRDPDLVGLGIVYLVTTTRFVAIS